MHSNILSKKGQFSNLKSILLDTHTHLRTELLQWAESV